MAADEVNHSLRRASGYMLEHHGEVREHGAGHAGANLLQKVESQQVGAPLPSAITSPTQYASSMLAGTGLRMHAMQMATQQTALPTASLSPMPAPLQAATYSSTAIPQNMWPAVQCMALAPAAVNSLGMPAATYPLPFPVMQLASSSMAIPQHMRPAVQTMPLAPAAVNSLRRASGYMLESHGTVQEKGAGHAGAILYTQLGMNTPAQFQSRP